MIVLNWDGMKRHRTSTGYIRIYCPDHPRASASSGLVYEHTLVAERALGKHLPVGAEVHHVNEDKSDNRPENLVIVQDSSYHQLLHRRMRAYRACGDARALKCCYCGKYDAPENLKSFAVHSTARHLECQVRYNTARRHKDRDLHNAKRRDHYRRNRVAILAKQKENREGGRAA